MIPRKRREKVPFSARAVRARRQPVASCHLRRRGPRCDIHKLVVVVSVRPLRDPGLASPLLFGRTHQEFTTRVSSENLFPALAVDPPKFPMHQPQRIFASKIVAGENLHKPDRYIFCFFGAGVCNGVEWGFEQPVHPGLYFPPYLFLRLLEVEWRGIFVATDVFLGLHRVRRAWRRLFIKICRLRW